MQVKVLMTISWATDIAPSNKVATQEKFTRYFGHILNLTSGYATWFTAGGAIRIALRQLLQNRKLRHL